MISEPTRSIKISNNIPMERSSCKESIERCRVQIKGKIHPEIFKKADEKFYDSLIQKPAFYLLNQCVCRLRWRWFPPRYKETGSH